MDIGLRRSSTVLLALVQALLGYEWLASALTKLVHGDFPSGLAQDLHERAESGGAYAGFLHDVVIPHAVAFGWAIQLGELAVALLLLAGVACAATGRLPRLGWAATGGGALAGAFLTLNFGLSDGARFFSLVAPDSFDEGMPLDVLATWLQLILVAAAAAVLLRRPAPAAGRLDATT